MGQPLQEDLDFLAHFGVKGMKWGVRKQRNSTPGQVKPKRMSRKERKAAQKQGKVDRLNEAFNVSAKDPNVLLKIRDAYGTRVVTGKEFTDHLIRTNGLIQISDISIYAQQAKPGGKYIIKG